MPDVVMPRLSDSMEEGTILKWLKSEGDEVSKGDELVEIETDKANMTYEADESGTLQIVAQEGDTLAVGEVIARIGEGGGSEQRGEEEPEAEADADEEPEAKDEGGEDESDEDEGGESDAEREPEPARAEGNGRPEGEPQVAERDAPKRAPSGNGGGDGRVKASPVARRMAREMGLDLQALSGSGPGGRIVKADVEAASKEGAATATAEAPAQAPEREAPVREEPPAEAAPEERKEVPPAPATADGGKAKGDVTVQELTRTQQVVARRMAESKATAPEFTLQMEIDMEQAVELRSQLKQVVGEGGAAPTFNDMVIKASALALREFPRANGAYRDGKFELYSRVNVGMAVAAHDALIVPTVFDADRKSLGEIARDARALAERVRAGAITPPELSGGTFTVSNLGMFGITNFTAVINPPQAAILAVGALAQKPVVRDGEIVARHTMGVTLACDHRILYGADAAEFLARIRDLLEQPLGLAL